MNENAFMELPKDKNDIPIHIGDCLIDNDNKFIEVIAVGEGEVFFWNSENENFESIDCYFVKRIAKGTLADILNDYCYEFINVCANRNINMNDPGTVVSVGQQLIPEFVNKYAQDLNEEKSA